MNHRNLVGIIPVHMQKPLNFGFEWDDVLMPIGPNITLIENAVNNCVQLGCSSIWVIANDSVQRLLKKRLGEYVEYEQEKNFRRITLSRKIIPIYYAPITTWDTDRIDSHSWAALHGCYIADYVVRRVSKWMTPKNFYISWPFGVHEIPKGARLKLQKEMKSIIFRYKGKTVKDGEYLGFVLDFRDAKFLRRRTREKGTLYRDWYGNPLRVHAQYSSRHFKPEDVFDELDTKNYTFIDVKDYYKIEDWKTYKNCLTKMKPIKDFTHIFKTKELSKIGVTNED